ncbi:MAG: non-canonical purine NTP pyrophosphatase [bacterium]
MKIVIATRNPAKLEYYQGVLEGLTEQVLGLVDFDIDQKPEELGKTARENAEIKARFYADLTGETVFCEDEALYADFLPLERQPGVYVRRVNGRELSDDELLAHWEEIIKPVAPDKRTGFWRIAYALAVKEGGVRAVERDHPIRFYYPASKIRLQGWPLSSIEGSTHLNKPHSERTPEEVALEQERNRQTLKQIFEELLSN